MSTTLNDIDLSLQDYVGNYTTGSAQTDVRYRAINRAVEYVKRVLAVPNDETIHTFWYSDDQFFYDLPDTFAEGLQLKYHNPLSNNPNSKWDYFDYPLVLQGVGGSRRNRWSITNINGKKQVVVVGNNGLSGQTLLAMDDITNVAASGDASGLAVSTVRYEGTGAIQFDIVKSTNTATITFSSLNLDLEELFERSGFMKFYAFMTEANISSISLKLQSSVGNFYTMSATVADDGSAFAQDDWQKIGFHTEDAVATLSPNLNAITTVAISFALGASFTTAADFMIDQLFTAFPEQM